MAYTPSKRSLCNLDGVHPILSACVLLAMRVHSKVDFSVNEGVRTVERQIELVEQGKSRTTKSKHLKQDDGYGHAVDLLPWVDGAVPWSDMEPFREINKAIQSAAFQLGVRISWGNDWDMDGVEVAQDPDESFVDAPHFEYRGMLP